MSIQSLWGQETVLQDPELLRREACNREYMLSLTDAHLLLNFDLEAGLAAFASTPKDIHGGWESPLCQLRGHFLGHWLSAAAMRYRAAGDGELKAKADAVVAELARCQEANGGEWAAPIPEKYFEWIAQGKPVWAPHYTVHKVFMGLLDMYRFAGNRQALEVADHFADWFLRYSGRFTREQFDDILDYETGGMLEIWALLLEATGDAKYRTLLARYRRGRLFEPLLRGEDVLTNMHENTTIPEILGCAAAYEATGGEEWRRIAEAYWKCAVDDRISFVTGGQSCGEIWTPPHSVGARLGSRDQEHCTVYNMMRLAEFLFRWTGDAKYEQYIEYNLYNGIMAQAYWKNPQSHGQKNGYPENGLLTYFLPLKAGSRKGWATETEDFFCCHGTLVQANAALGRWIYAGDGADLYVCQYFDSSCTFRTEGGTAVLTQREDHRSGGFQFTSSRGSISPVTREYQNHPDSRLICFAVSAEEPVRLRISFRIPEWAGAGAAVQVNGEPIPAANGSFAVADRVWRTGDTVSVFLPEAVRTVPAGGDDGRVAFAYGPLALAGLCSAERTLSGDPEHPERILVHDNEREWSRWIDTFRTQGQAENISFVPLRDIGYEPYTVYFPVQAPQK